MRPARERRKGSAVSAARTGRRVVGVASAAVEAVEGGVRFTYVDPAAGAVYVPLRADTATPEEALDELAEETGISGVYLEQLYTFGAAHRDPRERVISVSYYALVPQDALATPRAASDAAEVGWHAFDGLPPLAFDHAQIVAVAHRRLVAKLDYSTIAFQFMAKTFTLSELQCVYEALRDQPLDKRNFRKRILSLDLIEETGKLRRTGKHRPGGSPDSDGCGHRGRRSRRRRACCGQGDGLRKPGPDGQRSDDGAGQECGAGVCDRGGPGGNETATHRQRIRSRFGSQAL